MKHHIFSDGRRRSAVKFPVLGLVAAALLLPLLAGCPGTLSGSFPERDGGGTGTGGATGTGGNPGGGGAVAGCDAPAMVFQKESTAGGCLGSGCHSGVFPPDLRAGMLNKEMLKTAKATALSLGCSGQPYIDAAAPTNSVMWKKVAGGECGAQMPYMLPDHYLDATELACVMAWVAAP